MEKGVPVVGFAGRSRYHTGYYRIPYLIIQEVGQNCGGRD